MQAPGRTTARTEPQLTVLDCRGLVCPMPLLKTQHALARLEEGQVLEVWTTDPETELNVRAWAKAAGHEVTSLPAHQGVYRFQVRRSGPVGG